ncbi:hypothetical protein [Streptomyces sp. NPDC048508]|uniref:ISAzo13-like element transposase-related protein n=1 Tax=Streptomyces sp. NPDC048508 TaxID=3365561 RepID=UPI003722DD8E
MASLRQSRLSLGRARLLITAEACGFDGDRTRARKTELVALAAETGLEITVHHNAAVHLEVEKIEHRLFSHISTDAACS